MTETQAAAVPTPYYVYDRHKIVDQCDALSRVCQPGVTTALYSLKANPNPRLVDIIVKRGLGCDVSSEFELHVALTSGVAAQDIGCVGPYKPRALLRRCLQENIAFIALESLEELQAVARLRREVRSDTRTIVRINPSIAISGGSMKMGGAASQFGFSEEDLARTVADAARLEVPISGVHIYATTRLLDANKLSDNIASLARHIGTIADRYQLSTEFVNLGGGFGIPYYAGETELAIEDIRQQLLKVQNDLVKQLGVKRIFFETGRYIVGESGKAVVRVQSLKTSYDKRYAVCDGGYNIFQGATAFGSVLRKPYLIDVIHRTPYAVSVEPLTYCLVGPLCTPSDIIVDKFKSQPLAVGDYIVIRNVGAYSITSSPGLFIGHGFPAEYLLDDGRLRQIGSADTVDRMMHRYA